MYPDGAFLFGTWQDDRLNGLAKFKKKGSTEFEFVIYKNDMQIKSTKGGIKCEDCCYLIFAIMLMLGGYCALPLYFLNGTSLHNNEHTFWILGGCYLFYMIYSCCTSSSKYLRNCTDVDQVFRNIDMAIRSPPKVSFRIQCYHYETRIHTSTDSEGKTTTTTSQERVNTHYATGSFHFSTW